jgi:hypothetical protein
MDLQAQRKSSDRWGFVSGKPVSTTYLPPRQGPTTIDSDSEATDLTDDWTVPNTAIDLFGVPVIAGTLGGLSPTDGPCDKDAQGMDGVVVEIMAPQNVIIAHEVGHYMGLDHDESPLNLMNAAGSAANTTVTSAQGSTIKEHCSAGWY